MTTARVQFQKQKDLYEMWMAICPTDNFQKVLAHARADLMESGGMSSEMIHGANLLAMTLVTLCDTQEPMSPQINSGLTLDLSVKRNLPNPA